MPEDEVLKERFEKLYDLHEAWDVETYSMGYALHETFLGNIVPFMDFRKNSILQQ